MSLKGRIFFILYDDLFLKSHINLNEGDNMSLVDNFRSMKGSYADKFKELSAQMRKQLKNGVSHDDIASLYFDESKIEKYEQLSLKGNELEKYDYTPACCKKRANATEKGIKTARIKLQGSIPAANIDTYFIFSNHLVMRGGYNYAVDVCNNVATAAAIWILDELTLEGKLTEIFDLLPDFDENEPPADFIAPPLFHPLYERSLINSVVQMIRHRNSSQVFDKVAIGTINQADQRLEKDEESQLNRKAFDQVLSLIDPSSIKRVTERYESDVWEFYKLAFSVFYSVEERLSKLEREHDEIEDSLNKSVKPNAFAPYASKSSTDPLAVLQGNPERTRLITRRSQLEDEIDELYTIGFTDISLANDREKAVMKLKQKGIISEDLVDKVISFHVDDPFETAFALLYLLDTDSLVPWYYYGSISVAYTMCDQLPFDAPMDVPEEPQLLSEYNDVLYKHVYKGYRWEDRTDASFEPVTRSYAKNLSQLMFSSSLTLFPRVVPEQPGVNEYLDSLGELEKRERDAYSLLFHLLNAEKLRAEDYTVYKKLSLFLKNNEIDKAPETEDINELKSENARLRQKNQELVSSISTVISEKKSVETQVRSLRSANDIQSKELSDLRELVYLLNSDDVQEEHTDHTIKYPFKTEQKIISFGGHVSWINELKKKFPDVVFISPEMQPNTELIRNADTVWIQTNCIGHSDFYLIINTAKNAGIPIRYYSYSSADKCAEQLVNSIS